MLVFGVSGRAEAAAPDLRDQLRDLAQQEGFEIRGLDLVTREPARAVTGDLRYQIKRMLADYNYVVVDNGPGAIEKVIILARGRDDTVYLEQSAIHAVTASGEHIIPVRRMGAHQLVEAVLVGPGQVPQTVSLMVDTGASTVVLPQSMIGQLGFEVGELRDGWTQTANGRVRAKVGKLHSIAVGTAMAPDVTVMFLEDNRLSGAKLLGMSFLQRFRMTIDDANGRIILVNK
ncbi:MAG: retroviral-like aspartic protease family protein [Gammaproteobacteria bacterium]|nr:retroviral-like aspartic protease family protein [Gammaproteobacteria bacterium]